MSISQHGRRHFVKHSALVVGSIGLTGHTAGAAPASTEELSMGYEQYIGLPVSEAPTPALLVDLDIFEKNLSQMADVCRQRKCAYRPHGKAHKSSLVGKKQLAAGAGGICAGKLGEAEVFVAGGILDVLITTEVVGRRKIERLLQIAKLAPNLKVVADSEANVADLAASARAAGLRLAVLVDVNVGQNRTGVDTADTAAKVAQAIASSRSLRFAGVQAYGGTNMHVVGYENRRAASMWALERATKARAAIEKAGLTVEMMSVGGTGTYNIDSGYPGVTEIQPGSYIFMDSHYRSIGGESSDVYDDFGTALSVLTTVISRPSKGRAITDGGHKALSTDSGLPMLKDTRGVVFQLGGDEHGVLLIKDPTRDFAIGDKVEFIPSHCDTTVNLHNVFWAVRKGLIEGVWPIEARGRTD
ncbi:MAG: DSD1 family PLP-dependent enzyme [Acidobacteria bacterium]|nr:DSD1 family PLP-dependent enzyme [Acidobacteriota bacterium]